MSIAMSAPIIPSLLCISSSTMQLSGTHEITPFTLHIIPGSLFNSYHNIAAKYNPVISSSYLD